MLKRILYSSTSKIAEQADRLFVNTVIKQGEKAPTQVSERVHRERMETLLRIAQEQEDYIDHPDAFFTKPNPARLLQERIRPAAGCTDVFHVRWQSNYETFRSALQHTYNPPGNNRTAHARLYLKGGPPRPCVVLVHGYLAGKFKVDELWWPISWFDAQGFDVALFVLPHHGRRLLAGETRPMWPDQENVAITIEGMRQAVHDLRSFVSALKQRGHASVGVVGMSLGAFVSSTLATIDDAISFCIPLIPLASFADWANDHKTFHGSPEQRRDLYHALEDATRVISPTARPPKLQADRVVVLSGSADRINKSNHSERIAKHFDAKIAYFDGGHILQFGRKKAFKEALPMMRKSTQSSA